jgi:alpha-galactosidase
MKFLRELVGDRFILGCGVPLGCSFGLVDYCRIGSDVALKWEDKLLKKLHYRERVSTINSLTSTIGRRHLNNRAFLNDPDVFIVRSKGVELDKNQRYSLLLLNLIFGGLVFTSDNLEEYSEEEMKLYKSIFPIKDKRINKVIEDEILRVYFSIDDNEYLALCNLNSEQVVIKNKDEAYFCREKGYIPKNAVVTLEPYESICLLKTENVDESLLRSSNIFMI